MIRQTTSLLPSIRRAFDDYQVEAGVFPESGKHPHSKETYAQLAHWNEYGTARIPERPAFRTSFFENRRKYARKLRLIAQRGLQGNNLSRNSFDAIGREAVRDIERSILSSSRWVDNALSTQWAKGGYHQFINKPLVGAERNGQPHRHTMNVLDYKVTKK